MVLFPKNITDRRSLIAIIVAITVLLASIGAGFTSSKAGFHKSKHRHRTSIQKTLIIQEASRTQTSGAKQINTSYQQTASSITKAVISLPTEDYYNLPYTHNFVLSSLPPRASPLA